jgi:hypothetical protein
VSRVSAETHPPLPRHAERPFHVKHRRRLRVRDNRWRKRQRRQPLGSAPLPRRWLAAHPRQALATTRRSRAPPTADSPAGPQRPPPPKSSSYHPARCTPIAAAPSQAHFAIELSPSTSRGQSSGVVQTQQPPPAKAPPIPRATPPKTLDGREIDQTTWRAHHWVLHSHDAVRSRGVRAFPSLGAECATNRDVDEGMVPQCRSTISVSEVLQAPPTLPAVLCARPVRRGSPASPHVPSPHVPSPLGSPMVSKSHEATGQAQPALVEASCCSSRWSPGHLRRRCSHPLTTLHRPTAVQ